MRGDLPIHWPLQSAFRFSVRRWPFALRLVVLLGLSASLNYAAGKPLVLGLELNNQLLVHLNPGGNEFVDVLLVVVAYEAAE